MASMGSSPRERLVEAGTRLLERDGPEALKARKVAAEIGASTKAVTPTSALGGAGHVRRGAAAQMSAGNGGISGRYERWKQIAFQRAWRLDSADGNTAAAAR
jgi:hypothetical protein